MNGKKWKFNEPIDLVYTWVDGNDEIWKEKKIEWQKKLGIDVGDEINPCRFIDNDELKFSLRSVAKNAPWINHIYIVTNGQVPKWLNSKNSKITLVNHEEIMPPDSLPTFNSNAIETCLNNIPNLSEYFIYANDDFFIYRPITPDFFFSVDGKPKTILKKHSWSEFEIKNRLYQNNVTYSANLIKDKYGVFFPYQCHHNIMPYRKSDILLCKKQFEKEFQKTLYAKFRTKNCCQRTIISYFEVINKLAKPHFINHPEKYKEAMIVNINNPKSIKNTLNQNKPYLFCLNDNENILPENRNRIKSCLSEIYPDIQPWENQEEFQIEPIYDDNSINIVFCPDNNFFKYFAVTLESIIINSNKDEKYDVLIFESDVSDRNKEKLLRNLPENISIRFIDITPFIYEHFQEFKMAPKRNWSISMFYRLFIPIIMSKYKRVLYMDSDICVNHSLKELFSIDFKNAELCAVVDTSSKAFYSKRYLDLSKYRNEILRLEHCDTYFNSGVLLFNTGNINIEMYKQRFKETCKITDLLYPDQDILNIIFENSKQLISSKWNYLYGECEYGINYIEQIGGEYKKEFLEARQNPYIIHYTSPRKPWNSPQAEFADLWWHFARKTSFYEEIIYDNCINNSNLYFNKKYLTIKYSIKRHKLYLNYLRCKILYHVTVGKKRIHYKNKCKLLHEYVKNYREFLN